MYLRRALPRRDASTRSSGTPASRSTCRAAAVAEPPNDGGAAHPARRRRPAAAHPRLSERAAPKRCAARRQRWPLRRLTRPDGAKARVSATSGGSESCGAAPLQRSASARPPGARLSATGPPAHAWHASLEDSRHESDQPGRHGVRPALRRARRHHDAGPGVLLRRPRPPQERHHHHDAELRLAGRRHAHLGDRRLHTGLRPRRPRR